MLCCFRKSENEDDSEKCDAGAASGGLRVSTNSLVSFYNLSTCIELALHRLAAMRTTVQK